MRSLKNLRVFTGGIGVFLLVWFGQLISLIGSGLTSFAPVTVTVLAANFSSIPLIAPLAKFTFELSSQESY